MISPTRKRRLLALYVDYLVFSAVYQPVAWALRSMAPADNWLVALAVFLGLRVAAWAPVEPLLGLASPAWIATIAITILGGLNVAAGLLVLRTRLAGAVIGIGVMGAEVLAAIVHREDFRQWAGQAVVARRALQGLPVREGEVEMMQSLTDTVLPAVIAVGVMWLLVVALRFRANDRLTSHAADSVAST